MAKTTTFIYDPDTSFAGTGVKLSPSRYFGQNHAFGVKRRSDDGIVDTVAVVRALRGEAIQLSNREVIAAIALGASWGLSDASLSERLDMSERNVCRKRVENDIPPSVPPNHTRGYQRKESAA